MSRKTSDNRETITSKEIKALGVSVADYYMLRDGGFGGYTYGPNPQYAGLVKAGLLKEDYTPGTTKAQLVTKLKKAKALWAKLEKIQFTPQKDGTYPSSYTMRPHVEQLAGALAIKRPEYTYSRTTKAIELLHDARVQKLNPKRIDANVRIVK